MSRLVEHGTNGRLPAVSTPNPHGRLPALVSRTVAAFFLLNCFTSTCAPAWQTLVNHPDDWYRTPEGLRVTGNVLSWQSPHGSWPKNMDTTATSFVGDRADIRGTFDNGATTGELRFLARAFRATRDSDCEQSFLKGLDGILAAQYPTGGWPQFYPPGARYHRHITFNDDTMVRLLELLREVAKSPNYDFVDATRRQAARIGFDRGIQCILECQIRVNGELTVWCAQHDELDYRPRPGRAYELVSLSGFESAGILKLLMSLDDPAPDVVRAVRAGAAWFESARLEGIRVARDNGDRVVVKDPDAPPLWARFYEIEGNRPIFCGRDGVKEYNLAEIELERRSGYSWYGNWGDSVARDYRQWRTKWSGR